MSEDYDQDFRKGIDELCNKVHALQEENGSLQQIIKDRDSATTELRRELEETKRQLWGAERRVVSLEAERDGIRSELNRLRSANA